MSRSERKRLKRMRKHRGQNTHHIFCQQRFPHLRNEPWNQVEINSHKHDLMHWLFQNRTPEEIIEYLINYFWGGYIPKQLRKDVG